MNRSSSYYPSSTYPRYSSGEFGDGRRAGNSYNGPSDYHYYSGGRRRRDNPGFGGDEEDNESGSSKSVRVSRLIEKIKESQRRGGGSGGERYRNDGFSYVGGNVRDGEELIYSRVESGGGSAGKRTVRERVHNYGARRGIGSGGGRGGRHKTTVLINSSDGYEEDEEDFRGYNSDEEEEGYGRRARNRGFGGKDVGMRYFGEETDYEYDRVLSSKFNSVGRRGEFGGGNGERGGSVHGRASIPKIILHEEAVAEIPNGRGGGSSVAGGRSPSVLVRGDEQRGATPSYGSFRGGKNGEKKRGSRFLGGFLTLKRGNKVGGSEGNKKGGERAALIGGRSGTHSPSVGERSFLNVPPPSSSSKQRFSEHLDSSSSSPKYYVPYYRSTPTLYESGERRFDRGSSAGGSVLSSSCVNRHVSRSMSMKAPWEPRHRVNEINYYNEGAYVKGVEEEEEGRKKKGGTLKRSKSMPGKKLTSLIGSWVAGRKSSNGKVANGNGGGEEEEGEKLIKKGGKKGGGDGGAGKGRFNTLLRFGKKEESERKVEHPPEEYRGGGFHHRDQGHGTLLRKKRGARW